MTAPLVARSMDGQRSAGTLLRASQLVTTWGETPIEDARAAGLPRMEIAEFRAMQVLYTKCLRRSNALFETTDKESIHNLKMDLIKRIDTILNKREWGWADLARAMTASGKADISEQRVNNWRTRGIPASQVRAIETALGLKRYALDEDDAIDGEADSVTAEFAWVFRNANEKGREILRNAIKVARDVYVDSDRRDRKLPVIKDRRNT